MLADNELVERFLETREEVFFEELYSKYRESVQRYLHSINNRLPVEDISQIVWLKAFSALDSFDCERPFKPWIMKIAYNFALNELQRGGEGAKKHRSVHVERLEDLPSGRTTPLIGIMNNEERLGLCGLVGSLSPDHRRVIELFFYQDYTCIEIAASEGIKMGTVMSRLSRAKEALKIKIEGIKMIDSGYGGDWFCGYM
jgi:RNA polymerase sigma-70 factor, ECF subfamily